MNDHDAKPGNRPKFRDKRTERFAQGERIKQFQAFKEQAERRLDLRKAAMSVNTTSKSYQVTAW